MLTFLLVIEAHEVRNKLEQIYIEYQKQMYYMAYDILKNVHDAQDAVQTSILKLVIYIEEIEEIKCNKTKYLIVTIVRNTAIDIYRKKKNHPLLDTEDMDMKASDDLSLDDNVIRLSEAKMLAENLAKLKVEYADVLTLKYFYEFSDKEIANVLCISCDNVRVRLNRAKSKLKNLMNDNQNESVNRRMCSDEI